jgi:hypothetical protein
MTTWRSRNAPFLVGAALYAALLGRALLTMLSRTRGDFVYGCDDAYIHMAYAKQFAATGVWGVSGGEFAHASSSPLWTLLLAATFKACGPIAIAPLLFSVAASLALLAVANAAFARHGVAPVVGVLASCLLVVASPLAWLTTTGMEHVLQILLDVVFALLVARILAEDSRRPRDLATACVVAALVVATRLEGAFVVGAAALLFAWRRRFVAGAALLACGAAPVVLLGLVAMSHGWDFLPTSITLKAAMPSFASGRETAGAFGYHGLSAWASSAEMTSVAALALVALAFGTRRAAPVLVATVVAVAMHCQFARLHEERYTAYLVALGVVGAALAAADATSAPRPTAAKAALAVALLPLVWRGVVLEPRGPQAAKNVHDQQVQMARFFAESGYSTVALNDVGAASYYAGVHVVDVWGLATLDVARAKRAGAYTTTRLDEICRARHVRVAAVYDAWFDGVAGPELPRRWVRVAHWTIPDNVGCSKDTVSFYAVEPDEAEPLRRRLREFGPRLARDATWSVE